MTTPTTPNDSQIFHDMQANVDQPENPGYLQYWADRVTNDPADARVAKIVTGLTRVAIRGEDGKAEYTDRQPALQARYWYRSLGPLNPMTGVEHDLITAARTMYGQTTNNQSENANLQLDAAYSLSEIARVSSRPENIRGGILFGLDAVKGMRSSADYEKRDAKNRLQTSILEQDLRQDAKRLQFSGGLEPKPMDIQTYREFEAAFVREEIRGLEEFGALVKSGITDENFGILLEWFYIMSRRHNAWQNEEVDTVMVRGASSRENAEWTGEDEVAKNRITGNHDVVVDTYRAGARPRRERFQLKTVKGQTTYHPSVTVLDFQEIIKQRFGSIDGATKELTRKLGAVRRDYLDITG